MGRNPFSRGSTHHNSDHARTGGLSRHREPPAELGQPVPALRLVLVVRERDISLGSAVRHQTSCFTGLGLLNNSANPDKSIVMAITGKNVHHMPSMKPSAIAAGRPSRKVRPAIVSIAELSGVDLSSSACLELVSEPANGAAPGSAPLVASLI